MESTKPTPAAASQDPLDHAADELKAAREDAVKLRQELASLQKANSLLATLLSAQRRSLRSILDELFPDSTQRKEAA